MSPLYLLQYSSLSKYKNKYSCIVPNILKLMMESIKDLFICGKCRISLTDLNIFLTHRSACNGQQLPDLSLLSTDLFSKFPANVLDPVSQSVPTAALVAPSSYSNPFDTENLPSPFSAIDLCCEQNNVDVLASTSMIDFDLLFTNPTEQTSFLAKAVDYDMRGSGEHPPVGNRTSQTDLNECPVCLEQFQSTAALENHVFEHSMSMVDERNSNESSTFTSFLDYSSIDYIDSLSQRPITQFGCLRCTMRFDSNTALTAHERVGMFMLLFSRNTFKPMQL